MRGSADVPGQWMGDATTAVVAAADGPFTVWDAGDPGDYAAWAAAWSAWPGREVFAHPGYVSLDLGPGERALCAAFDECGARILYPFVLRDLRHLPAWEPRLGPAYDVTSPYGYGGTFAWADPGDGVPSRANAAAEAFWRAFDAWAAGQPVVSEFVRCSLFGDELAPYPGRRETRLPNVVRGLDLDDARLWADFEHKVRKNVHKAQRSGVEIEVDVEGTRLDEFLAVYDGTMQRRGAAAAYRHPRAYFERLAARLPGQFAYFHAVHGGAVVSSELVLVSAWRAYSFLGGTRAEAFALRPNDLLKYEVVRWARARGLGAFVLGGGPEPNDGIYRYKLSFAPRGAVPFQVGTRVLRPDLFAALEGRQAALRPPGGAGAEPPRFPSYRF